jgi:O-antigen/teichoic acid export membrane protein
LKDKIIKGGFWLGLSKISIQLFSFLINALLAYFLKPESFGLISVVTVFLGFVSLFTNIGFGASIIQKKDITSNQINTLFTVNFITYFVTAVTIYFTSGIVADFYNTPELSSLIKWSCISVVVPSLYVIKRKLLEKKLEFKILSKIDVISSVFSGIAGIISAFLKAEAYSLVIQAIFLSLFYLVLINYYEKFKLKFAFYIKETKDLIIYSIKYKLSQATNYLERNIDYMLIGKLFNPFILGIYTFAFNIMYFPIKRISYVFTEILFASFSIVQNDYHKLRIGFLKSIRIISIITFPMMLIVSFFCKDLLQTVYGNKWNDAVPIIQILSIAGAIQSVEQVSGVIFDAIKKTQINIYLGIVKIIFISLSVLIGSKFGLRGVAMGITIYKFITFLVSMYLLKRIIELQYSQVISFIKGPLLGSASIILLYFAFNNTFLVQYNINIFFILAFVVVVYLLIISFFNKSDVLELYYNIRLRSSSNN